MQAESRPETEGITVGWAHRYDLLAGVFGLGVNSRGSRMVVEMAGVKPGEAVLDVACGTGSLTLTAQRYAGPGGAVYGIDAAPEMIAQAKRKAAKSGQPIDFRVGLAESLPFADATFDVVISRLAIHHLPPELKRRAFAEILRVLKPGGRFLAADFRPPRSPVVRHVLGALVGQHMMETSMAGLDTMLAEAGFTEVAAGNTRSAILGFVSGRKPAGGGG